MKNKIRILLIEDSPTDEELIRHALQDAGFQFELNRVDNREDYLRELNKAPDLVLSDFSLPAFDGFSALAIAREKQTIAPFIFVTGTLGEEVAIETLKKGATDYVLKHRLSRLAPSVERALREARERAARKRAQEELRESHEQLRCLSVYLQYVREEERTHIAREVHDELGQALTGLKLQLVWLGSRLPTRSRALRDKVKSMMSHIDRTIQTVRRISTQLRPGVLDTAGLLAAIEWQANDFAAQTGIPCAVHSEVEDTIWNHEINTAFFRIFQETLTNIIRHADAKHVSVRLAKEDNHLVLEVTDDGRGITAEQLRSSKSLGLVGMSERAALLGGNVKWRGAPGQGTTVTARVPLPATPQPPAIRPHENPDHG